MGHPPRPPAGQGMWEATSTYNSRWGFQVQQEVKDEFVEIRFIRLSRGDIDSLHEFLKSQKTITRVHTRVQTMDAVYDPSLHPKLATIVGFSVGVVGKKVLDIVADCAREWLKNRKTEDPNAEILIVYGADEKIAARVKREPSPKAK